MLNARKFKVPKYPQTWFTYPYIPNAASDAKRHQKMGPKQRNILSTIVLLRSVDAQKFNMRDFLVASVVLDRGRGMYKH